MRDYLDPPPPSNIKGTGIFSEFLENITPTTLEKVGLDTLIKKEEQRLKDTGSTVGPKVCRHLGLAEVVLQSSWS